MSRVLLCFYLIAITFFTAKVFADEGEVIRENVCGSGNAIIETTDGWFIAAEYYSGFSLYEGDVVYGNMKTYGLATLEKKDGDKGNFYIKDFETEIWDAVDELCD